ncbi:hypothetical protein DNTS_032813 [Danionella cerebrum]|uniref:Uncharacterized protein n=1 Tax=Danionella cerebrum TaxID=2873325 RepID=A0A553RNC3_9TELE|nr:hypothetical protein DNTS_032813 [Danionella translucida]
MTSPDPDGLCWNVPDSLFGITLVIFDESLPERLTPLSRYQNHTSPDPLRDLKVCERRNNPHPLNASFIRTNVRFLNEPVPHMENADQQSSARSLRPALSAASSRREAVRKAAQRSLPAQCVHPSIHPPSLALSFAVINSIADSFVERSRCWVCDGLMGRTLKPRSRPSSSPLRRTQSRSRTLRLCKHSPNVPWCHAVPIVILSLRQHSPEMARSALCVLTAGYSMALKGGV